MSWIAIAPFDRKGNAGVKPQVIFRVSASTGRYAAACMVCIYPENIGGLTWIKVGGQVSLDLGEGPNAGQLRIKRGGPFIFKQGTGGSSNRCAMVRFPILKGIESLEKSKHFVEFDHGDDWLSLTLPKVASLAPAPAPTAAPAKAPFVSAIADVPVHARRA